MLYDNSNKTKHGMILHTFKGAVVVSMLVTTNLLVKSATDVKRKNDAAPMDTTTITIQKYLPWDPGRP